MYYEVTWRCGILRNTDDADARWRWSHSNAGNCCAHLINDSIGGSTDSASHPNSIDELARSIYLVSIYIYVLIETEKYF